MEKTYVEAIIAVNTRPCNAIFHYLSNSLPFCNKLTIDIWIMDHIC